MAVLGRLLVSSGERLDLPDFLSLDSYTAGDWSFFLKGLVGSAKPYILKGFDVIEPQSAIGTQSCSVRVADSMVFYPGSNAGAFYHGLEDGNNNALPLVPELRKNTINYVYLTFSTFNTAVDTRAFWDSDKDGGAGGEFTQDVNTESVLKVDVNVSTGSFPANTIPIAKITVGSVVITKIEDARDLMFRLGAGGIAPNPYNQYGFRSLPSAPYKRVEPSTSMVNPSDPNPFQGADKNIYSLKEWMDVVMTKLLELGGTTFWYEDTSTTSLVSIFNDALAVTFKSKGQWSHSTATPGLITWTEDVLIKSTNSPEDLIIRAGNKTLLDDQVMYLPLAKNQIINAFDQPITWVNGAIYVNTIGGAVGLFANLVKGDWIKKPGDGKHLFVRVEEFYDTISLGGLVTTAASARSVRLSAAYQGVSGDDKARYDKGVYQPSDVVVSNRNSAALTSLGGNFHWMAIRSDTIENIATIQSFTIAGTLSEPDGQTAKIVSAAHGLADGDLLTVTAPAAHAGTYAIEVEDTNTFYIPSSAMTVGAFTAFYALSTTSARDNSYGLQLESANHDFVSGDTVIVSGTTNFNGSRTINKRSATQFQFAASAVFGAEVVGFATLARVLVRYQTGSTTIIQGEVVDISGPDSQNIRNFIGMASQSQSNPFYVVPISYNTLDGMANYNTDSTENLTARTSKLTAMMADKAQDRTLKYLTTAVTAINTANGAAQELTFLVAASTLTILQPGSAGNAVITLPDTAPGISLLVNQSAYVSIDRNAATTPSIVVADTASIAIDENIIIIASRLNDATVYIWNGTPVSGSVSLIPSGAALIKVNYHDPLSLVLPTGNPVTIDNVSIIAGDLVLFSALTLNPNRIYKAVGTGTNITSWTAQFSFNGSLSPSDGDTVIVLQGAGFADQIGKFTGLAWVFNDKVRYFNGADYWEQSNIVTSTLLDNTVNNVFTVNLAGSEYMVIDYSLVRDTTRETGTIHITSDGVNANITTSGAYIGSSGVSFSGDIVGPLLRLRYTASSTGSDATMKYMIRRWSNGSGGPGGVPSYSGATGSGVAGGANQQIQYNNGGLLAGNANFLIDVANLALNLNGAQITVLSSGISIVDNTPVPAPLFTYSKTSFPYAVIEYSIERNNEYRVGRLLVSNNGTITSASDDFVDTAIQGVNLTADIVGSNVRILYDSTSTGFNGTFKYNMRRWS